MRDAVAPAGKLGDEAAEFVAGSMREMPVSWVLTQIAPIRRVDPDAGANVFDGRNDGVRRRVDP